MEAAELMTGRAKHAISIIATEIEGVRSRKSVLLEQKATLESQIGELDTLEQSKLTDVRRIQEHVSALELAATSTEDIRDLLAIEAPKRGLHRELSNSSVEFTSRVLEEFLKSNRLDQFSKEDIVAGLQDRIPAETIEKTFSQRAWYLVQQGRARQVGRGVFVYQT